MAKGPTVTLTFAGDDKDLSRTLKSVEAKTTSLADKLGSAGKTMALFGSATGVGAAAVGVALPALASLGLMFGVASAAIGGSTEALDAHSKAVAEGKGDFTEYNKLLAKMTPEQREFTKAVVEAKKPLSDLQKTAGRSFLPGVTKFLKDAPALFPTLDAAVGRTGKIMSDTAEDMGELFKSDKFKQNLDGLLKGTEPITRQIGDTFVRLTDRVVEFGAEMAPASEGFASFLDGMTSGLEGFFDGLAPHAEDFKSIWESLGSIMEDVLPIIGELAGELAEQIAPVLKDIAGFIRDNKAAISEWVPFIAQAALALAGLKVAQSVKGWLDAAGAAFDSIGRKADDAATKVGKDGGKGGKGGGLKGSLRGIGIGVGVGGALVALGSIGDGADQAKTRVTGLHDSLRAFAVAGGTFNIGFFFDEFVAEIEYAKVVWHQFKNLIAGWKPTPIVFEADAGPAERTVGNLIREINGHSPEVNINGNTNGAGFALRTILDEIAAGKEFVTIDGKPVPAQKALADVKRLIDNSVGTVTVNGKTMPASQAVAMLLGQTNRSHASIGVGANTADANNKIGALVRNWNGRNINIYVTTHGTGGIASAGRWAKGGPVFGPGSATSDSVPAWLSDGEFVATAKQVQNAGGTAAFARLMATLDKGRVTGFSGGGAVGGRRGSHGRGGGGAPGNVGTLQLVVAGNVDSHAGAFINGLIRTGKIQGRLA